MLVSTIDAIEVKNVSSDERGEVLSLVSPFLRLPPAPPRSPAVLAVLTCPTLPCGMWYTMDYFHGTFLGASVPFSHELNHPASTRQDGAKALTVGILGNEVYHSCGAAEGTRRPPEVP